MSKTITFPKCRNPFYIYVNGKLQTFRAGETVEVDDSVADVIQNHIDLQPKEDPNAGKVTGGVGKAPQIVDRTVTEITAEDLAGATNIGDYAFYNSRNIASIEIPSSVTKIGAYAFQYCVALEEIVVPNGVETIGHNAFANCSGLKRVDLPASLNSLGNYVFGSSLNIEKMLFRSPNPPTISSTTLNNVDYNKMKIVVPCGCGQIYRNATNWSKYEGEIVEEEYVPTGKEKWLFKDEYVAEGAFVDLPAPVAGVYYTCFVDGEEICARIATDDAVIDFSTEDSSVIFRYEEDIGWFFHPEDSMVKSGTVSIRING